MTNENESVVAEAEPRKTLAEIKQHYLSTTLTHYNALMTTLQSMPINQNELVHAYYQLQCGMLFVREFINSLVEKPPVEDAAPQENGDEEKKPEA